MFLDTRIGVDFFGINRLSARNLWISHVVNDRFPVNFSCSFCVVSQILHECLPHFPLIFLCIVIGFSWDFHLIFFWLSLDFHRSFGGFSSDFLLTFMFGVDAGTMSLQMHTLVVWGMLYEILIPRCGLKAKQLFIPRKSDTCGSDGGCRLTFFLRTIWVKLHWLAIRSTSQTPCSVRNVSLKCVATRKTFSPDSPNE